MGRLKLDCLAVSPNNSVIYGIGNTYKHNSESPTQDKGKLILVRSDPNPTSFKNIRWTVVSVAPASHFRYWAQSFGTVSCAVSQSGVFSAMVNWRPPFALKLTDLTGLTYDPAKDVAYKNDDTSAGWKWVSSNDDSYWGETTFRSQAAIYLNQTQKAEGSPVRERFIHAALGDGGVLRLASFGPHDPSWNDTKVSWDLKNPSANITSPPLFVRLGQSHAHAYYQETASIISYPLTDVAAPIPAGIVTKLMDGGIVLDQIIPGVRNGTSFLACLGTNPATNKSNIYFIYNYLGSTTPSYSTLYPVDSSSLNLLLNPYQFVHSLYPSPTSPGTLNQLDFGISITNGGDLYGINLSGNSTSNTVGQTSNSGSVYVDAPYDSYSTSTSGPTTVPPPEESRTNARSMAWILVGIGAAFFVWFVVYRVWRRRVDRKMRALQVEPVGDRGEHLGPSIYQPPQYGLGQGQGQGVELTTPAVPYRQQHNPSARHDGADAPPPYSA